MTQSRWMAAPAVLLVLALTACGEKIETRSAKPQPVGDSSATSVDWNGTYRGVVPCADCEGIETTVTLNPDLTYALTTRYLGRDDQVFERSGAFAWDATGGIVRLQGVEDGPALYRVGENVLIQLDLLGEPIAGELAEHYRLRKVAVVSAPQELCAPGHWRLTELRGKPVTVPADRKAPFLVFEKEGRRVHGFGGCNNIFGSVEFGGGERVRFAKLGATLMACPDLESEGEFLKTLEAADSYFTDGRTLTLHRARMAPLAVFEAAAGEAP